MSSVFFLFIIFTVSFPAFSISKAEVVGTWRWSSAGCRDANLSMSSHRPIPDTSQNPDFISEATFVFNQDDSASMDFKQAGESQRYDGTFRIDDGNKVILVGSTEGETFDWPLMVVNNNSRLAVVRCESDLQQEKENTPNINQAEMDEKIKTLRKICGGQNKCFVYLIGKI